MSWVAVAAGAVSAGAQAVSANQTKQRNKGRISEAYRLANQRLAVRQTDVDTSTGESLAARGLLQGGGGSAIRAAIKNGSPVSTGPAATDLGSQARSDLGKEFALEREDSSQQEAQAQNENKAAGMNAEISAIGSGFQIAGAVQGMKRPAIPSAGAASAVGSPSAIRQVYSGIDDPMNTWGGIHPVDPLNHPTSSWNRVGAGEANVDFNVG